MKFLKKLFCFICLISFIVSSIPIRKNVVLANENISKNLENIELKSDEVGEYIEYENGDKVYLSLNNVSRRKKRSVSGVVIFVGGILAGWIIDGVMIYATGATGGEWVARAFQRLASNPKAKAIYLSKPNCSIYPPHSQFGCY